jgi:HEAT repeat protein
MDNGKRISALIEILFDPQAREDEIEDAISYLGEYDDQRAVDALIQMIQNPNVNYMFKNDCLESLGRIVSKSNSIEIKSINSLPADYKKNLIEYVNSTGSDFFKNMSL